MAEDEDLLTIVADEVTYKIEVGGGRLVPNEIFPQETRSAGQSIPVATNLNFTFVIAQAFLTILCHFNYSNFLFFAGWVFILKVFIYFFLP